MLLADLTQAGFMGLALLPEGIVYTVGNVILHSIKVALQCVLYTTMVFCGLFKGSSTSQLLVEQSNCK